jgi:hypothetical protein
MASADIRHASRAPPSWMRSGLAASEGRMTCGDTDRPRRIGADRHALGMGLLRLTLRRDRNGSNSTSVTHASFMWEDISSIKGRSWRNFWPNLASFSLCVRHHHHVFGLGPRNPPCVTHRIFRITMRLDLSGLLSRKILAFSSRAI